MSDSKLPTVMVPLVNAVLYLLRDRQHLNERRVQLNARCDQLPIDVREEAEAELRAVKCLIEALEKAVT